MDVIRLMEFSKEVRNRNFLKYAFTNLLGYYEEKRKNLIVLTLIIVRLHLDTSNRLLFF